MPQLGETVTEGTITRWAKQVGERVDEDEVLFEVSTDKVDSEVPSPAAGYLAEILVGEGQTVDVGTKLAVISADPPGPAGEDAAEPVEATLPPEVPVETADEATEVATKAQDAGAPEQQATAEAVRSEVARGQAEAARVPEPAAPPTSGVGTAGTQGGTATARGGDGSRLLSPVVRRLIGEHGLDPDQIPGTGSGGRITRADVLSFIDAGGPSTAPPSPPEAPVPAPPQEIPARPEPPRAAPRPEPPAPLAGARPGERDVVIPFSNIRKRTADHMRRSLDTSAHTLVVIDVDYDGVDRVRLPQRDRFKTEEGVSLTYLPFIARAVVDAIRDFPQVNASVGEEELTVHRYVNLGIAVDLSFEGLIVPVVHDAEGKRLRVLAKDIADVASRARSKKLGADDISGGTFTITNAGGYGTFITGPIISQPQVAILSTDGVKPRPVAVPLPGGGYGIAVHPVGNLAISFDHRPVDGAYAAAFLARVKEILETRDWSQELA